MSWQTPGPWYVLSRNHLCIEAPSGNVALCNLARDNETDAAFIVKACNAHDELVAAARIAKVVTDGKCPTCGGDDLHSAIVDDYDGLSCCDCDWSVSYAPIRAALAKADA